MVKPSAKRVSPFLNVANHKHTKQTHSTKANIQELSLDFDLLKSCKGSTSPYSEENIMMDHIKMLSKAKDKNSQCVLEASIIKALSTVDACTIQWFAPTY
jgi:hypothetical protein